MKVLLKQPVNGLFLKDSTHWTGSFAEALDFKTIPSPAVGTFSVVALGKDQ